MLRMLGPLAVYFVFVATVFAQPTDPLLAAASMGAQGGVNFPRGVKDALQAAEHLRRFEFVAQDRIALAGYS